MTSNLPRVAQNPAIYGLTKQELDGVKGFLIILVVIGHSAQIASINPDINRVIYSFHMFCFLALAFLVTKSPIDKKFVITRAIRYLVPHFIFLTFTAVVFLIVVIGLGKFPAWLGDLGLAWIIGSGEKVKAVTGFTIFWYLPSFFILVISISILKRYKDYYWPASVLIGMFSLGLGVIPTSVLNWVPLGIPPVVFVFLPGAVATFIWLKWLHTKKIFTIIIAGFIFFYLSCFLLEENSVIDIAHFSIPSIYSPLLFFFHNIIFICSIVLLYSFGDLLGKSNFIQRLGRHSMGIFLISQLVNQFLLRIFSITLGEFNSNSALHSAIAIILVVAVIAISWGISEIVHGVRVIRTNVFPRDIGDWSIFRKFRYHFNTHR